MVQWLRLQTLNLATGVRFPVPPFFCKHIESEINTWCIDFVEWGRGMGMGGCAG